MALTCLMNASAQDSTKTPDPVKTTTITGSVDAYYRFNFANSKVTGSYNNPTSFTNSHNSFELGMASIKVAHSFGKIGAVADLGFGTRAKEFSYNETGISQAVKQAYLTYAPSSHVTFTMGKFATHVGYELLDPQLNRNYSMSYMFSYGPFSHTGLKMDVAVNGNFGFMLGVSNPTDFLSASFKNKSVLAQIHANTTDGKFAGYLNYVGGKDTSGTLKQNQLDLTILTKLTSKFGIGLNATMKRVDPDGPVKAESWSGAAIYLNVDPTEKFGFCVRGEYFSDKKNVTGYFGTSLYELTATLNIKPVAGLMIMPEFRFDGAKDQYFVKHDGTGTKSTASFLLAAVYSF
ncbi:MAG TPA: porin [Chitinophagaceae bacterium]|nr:porin [Chitinophagaceae bacterium]